MDAAPQRQRRIRRQNKKPALNAVILQIGSTAGRRGRRFKKKPASRDPARGFYFFYYYYFFLFFSIKNKWLRVKSTREAFICNNLGSANLRVSPRVAILKFSQSSVEVPAHEAKTHKMSRAKMYSLASCMDSIQQWY